MLYTIENQRFMARAIELAKKPILAPHPNPRVGCVLVKNGIIIAEGFHARCGEGHAEQVALAQAGEKANGAEAYVTLEPCNHQGKTPACAAALIRAGISTVYYACDDPNNTATGGSLSLAKAGVAVHSGLLHTEAAQLNRGFFQMHTVSKPWVSVKMALSLDGRTAMASGESQWITGPESRLDVHHLRAQAAAVITGIGTIEQDNARLTVRLPELAAKEAKHKQPLRVIIDSIGQLLPQAACLHEPGQTWVYTAEPALLNDFEQQPECTIKIIPLSEGRLSLASIVDDLAQHGYHELLVEAGPRLAGSFLQSNLVNEIILYVSPKLLGHEANALFHLPGLESLKQAYPLKFQTVQTIGNDLRITLQVLNT